MESSRRPRSTPSVACQPSARRSVADIFSNCRRHHRSSSSSSCWCFRRCIYPGSLPPKAGATAPWMLDGLLFVSPYTPHLPAPFHCASARVRLSAASPPAYARSSLRAVTHPHAAVFFAGLRFLTLLRPRSSNGLRCLRPPLARAWTRSKIVARTCSCADGSEACCRH